MKSIVKGFACALAAVAVSASAFAQSNFTKTYETAGPGNNWFISLGGGINYGLDGVLSGTNTGKIGPSLEFSVGKWVSPTVGARVGYTGLTTKVNDSKFWNNQIHADALWNVSNQFWGYKADRVYNFIPYASAGLMVGGAVGSEFTLGAGLLNNFRISDRVLIFLDVRGSIMRGEQLKGDGLAGILYANVGLTVNLGKKVTFNEAGQASGTSDEELQKALADAQQATADAQKAAEEAQKEAEAAKAEAAAAKEEAAKANADKEAAEEALMGHITEGPLTVYFEIGKSELNHIEAKNLTDYLDYLLAENKDQYSFVLTGSADTSTGTQEVNERLCNERVAYVKNVLVSNYGIDESKITVQDNVYSDDTDNPEFSRSVLIEH